MRFDDELVCLSFEISHNGLWLCVRRGFESTKVYSTTKAEESKTAQ